MVVVWGFPTVAWFSMARSLVQLGKSACIGRTTLGFLSYSLFFKDATGSSNIVTLVGMEQHCDKDGRGA